MTSRRQAARDFANDLREEGDRVAIGKDRENTKVHRNGKAVSNKAATIRSRVTGKPGERRI